ncbi:transcriptional activator Spt7 [Encephalitozoon intestinalis ATCC 50506]|uniref:Transcriptional activator Spt7 n=1 Tax=Encephalitozoon intestinalis (strain ATCC 50506) TaxID=876142 RepID=E0S8M9_ENCIT|nr:transcriptional activator Spt7 [Encephalitozoon intestinalis ATCC 50506]ADM12085.1 transcriptional activator Spt7 [Encephalitozoon intestinalis ATCC 50506]UTX45878.1 bromodomain-containing protein [Encephalitozoon intestinalis]
MAAKKMWNMFLLGLISTNEKKRKFLDRMLFLPGRLTRILTAIKSFDQSKIFLRRVLKKDAPNYYEVIKKPMDLSIVQKKIGKYRSFEEFKADLNLIWDNCLKFNQEKYYRDCAFKMREVVSTFEIEVVPVKMDSEFAMGSNVWEGEENQGPAIKWMIRRMIGRVLLLSGYGFVSKTALWVFCDVFQHKILEIVKEECKENGK